jgi:hypothetical protein
MTRIRLARSSGVQPASTKLECMGKSRIATAWTTERYWGQDCFLRHLEFTTCMQKHSFNYMPMQPSIWMHHLDARINMSQGNPPPCTALAHNSKCRNGHSKWQKPIVMRSRIPKGRSSGYGKLTPYQVTFRDFWAPAEAKILPRSNLPSQVNSVRHNRITH